MVGKETVWESSAVIIAGILFGLIQWWRFANRGAFGSVKMNHSLPWWLRLFAGTRPDPITVDPLFLATEYDVSPEMRKLKGDGWMVNKGGLGPRDMEQDLV